MCRVEEVAVGEFDQLPVLDHPLVDVPPHVDGVAALVPRDGVDLVPQREVVDRRAGLRRGNQVGHDVLVVLRLPLADHFLEQRGHVWSNQRTGAGGTGRERQGDG